MNLRQFFFTLIGSKAQFSWKKNDINEKKMGKKVGNFNLGVWVGGENRGIGEK